MDPVPADGNVMHNKVQGFCSGSGASEKNVGREMMKRNTCPYNN